MSQLLKSSMLKDPPKAIEFLVGDRKSNSYSYTWKVWADKTSFYIAQKDGKLFPHKFSLHGKDSRHPSGPVIMFRDSNESRHKTAFIDAPDGFFPCRIGGVERFKGVRWVLRFRFTWDMFSESCPSAVPPKKLKSGRQGVLIPPPGFMKATDVDFFYSSNGWPQIPIEKDAIRKNAVIGPLRNENGEFLVGQVSQKSLLLPGRQTPEPTVSAPLPKSRGDINRGLSFMCDGTVMWVVENKFSQEYMNSQLDPRGAD